VIRILQRQRCYHRCKNWTHSSFAALVYLLQKQDTFSRGKVDFSAAKIPPPLTAAKVKLLLPSACFADVNISL